MEEYVKVNVQQYVENGLKTGILEQRQAEKICKNYCKTRPTR